MKKLTILICFIFIVAKGFAQTYISGVISSNATWTQANSPYIVTANTVVMQNIILNIEPGVLVRFLPNVQLALRGTLIGLGTSTDTITFTADDGITQWNGVSIDNSSYNPKVNLRYFKGEYASSLFHVVSYYNSTDTLIKFVRCAFNNDGFVVEEEDAIKPHQVSFDSCVVSYVSGYCGNGASNYIIKNSKFYGVGSNAGAFYNSVNQNTIIDNCEFSEYAHNALTVNGIITNSTFYNNNIAINVNPYGSPILHYNNIHDNQIGLFVWQYGTINSSTQITNNRICNNAINAKKKYNADVYLINNCWCLQDSTQIASTIYDFFDAPDLGMMYFIPFDTNCTHITPGIGPVNEPVSTFNVFPNPATDNLTIETPDKATIEILNIEGQIIKTIKSDGQETTINLSNISNGIYIIQAKTDKEIMIKKFLKQ